MNLIFGTIFWVLLLAVITVPVMLGVLLTTKWLKYVRYRTFFTTPYILLELHLPKEITKSPVGMEIFFTALFQTGAASYHETFWQGKIRPTFSFELVSIGGEVHFFIYARKAWRNLIEAQIYAQYPNVEIREAEDYTANFTHDLSKYNMWGGCFKLGKPNAYPIKTYVDFGLDKDPKEEFKIDPMTSVLEYLGSLKKGEQTWIQIIIQAHKKESWKEGHFFERPDWKASIAAEVKKIRESTVQQKGDTTAFANPTKGQAETIAALERSLAKLPFEVVIRGIYAAENDLFNKTMSLSGLIGAFRQYGSVTMNEIKLGAFTDFGDTGKDLIYIFGFIPPFKKFMRNKRTAMEQQFLKYYKWRFAFLEPVDGYNPKPFILTTEELASIFHFPGMVASTPTLARVTAKKSEPPPNLPI